jgi:hypothetical protein
VATAGELWGRVRRPRQRPGLHLDRYEAFGVLDPSSEGSEEYEAAWRDAGRAWVRAEEADEPEIEAGS